MSASSSAADFTEWQWVDVKAPLTRDGAVLRCLFSAFPIDAGWTVVSPPLLILSAVKSSEFKEKIESIGGLEKITRNFIEEFVNVGGIPNEFRVAIWKRLVQDGLTGSFDKVGSGDKWGLRYPALAPHGVSISSEVATLISNDVKRTHPEQNNPTFHDKLSLILTNFAFRNPKIGYCQGLNFVASAALQAGLSQGDAFQALVLFAENICADFYIPSLSGLHEIVEQISSVVKLNYPEVITNLERLQLPFLWLVAEPLLCVFARTFPLYAITRIWDFVLFHGKDGLIAIQAGFIICCREVLETESEDPEGPSMAHLQAFQRKAQTLAGSDMEKVMLVALKILEEFRV